MNILEVLNYIKDVAADMKLVKYSAIGDVYANFNIGQSMKYVAADIDIENIVKEDNYIQYNLVLYVADRLLIDESNEMLVKADCQNIIQSILNEIEEKGDVADGYTITFFKQKFIDSLAGAYCEFTYNVPSTLGPCSMDDYDE